MMAIGKFACLALVLAAAPRCESDTRGPVEVPVIPTATIQGFVTNGGIQIGGAEVSISGNGTTRTASTGPHGFRFADLPPGSYALTATGQGLVCEPTSAAVRAGESITASIACASQPTEIEIGTVVGTLTAGGSPISGVLMLVADNPSARATDVQGRFAFDLPAGEYTISPLPRTTPGTTCASASVVVEPNHTISVEIACQPTGRLAGELRWPNGLLLSEGRVTVSGPISREVEISPGGFVLDGLPPGSYTVSASAGGGCESAAGTVVVAQATNIAIDCEFFSMDIPGNWMMSLPRDVEDFDADPLFTQMGTCPAPLPAEEAVRTIVSGPASGTISIAGVDPEGAISGSTNDLCGDICGILESQIEFTGSGRAVRSNGSSILSEVTGVFRFDATRPGWMFGNMTRTHLGANGDVACVETYWIQGRKL